MKKANFIKEVEKLIDPITVGTMAVIQYFNGFLPKKVQNKMMKSASAKTPQMGFVVDPYSFFLFYEIKDLDKAKELLPDGFKLIKTKVFVDDDPNYYAVFGCFNTHTNAFYGFRMEFNLIAENEDTNLLSWIIIDYDTNTISYDKKHGLTAPNASKSFLTTNYDGKVLVEVNNNDRNRKLAFESDITKGKMKALDQRLWLEGNLSVGYGKPLMGSKEDIFSLKFNAKEVEQALEIPLENFMLEENTWYSEILNTSPTKLVCFPYAQHYLSDSPGFTSNLKNKDELDKAYHAINFDNVKVFSTNSFKRMFLINMIVSFIIEVVLLILLIIK